MEKKNNVYLVCTYKHSILIDQFVWELYAIQVRSEQFVRKFLDLKLES